MKNLYLTLCLLASFLFASVAKATVINGVVTYNNIALTSGTLHIQLYGCINPLINSSSGNAATANYTIKLNPDGSIPSSSITGNDTIYCSGALGTTYYEIKAYNSGNVLVWDRYYKITSAYWNIGTATILNNFSTSSYIQSTPSGDQTIAVPSGNNFSIVGGTTLIGNLLLGQDPTVTNGAATKSYVDSSINGAFNGKAVNFTNIAGTVALGQLPTIPNTKVSGLGAAALHGVTININSVSCPLDGSCTISSLNTPATNTSIGSVRLAAGQTSSVLSTVATTGSYTDLSNLPSSTATPSNEASTSCGTGTITLNPNAALNTVTLTHNCTFVMGAPTVNVSQTCILAVQTGTNYTFSLPSNFSTIFTPQGAHSMQCFIYSSSLHTYYATGTAVTNQP